MTDLTLRIRNAVLGGLCAAAVTATAGIGIALADSSTIRIHNGTPYGAIVTRERGVTVYRALPPTQRVIINPDGKTPLSLTINELEVNEQTTVNNVIRLPNQGYRTNRRYYRY